METGLNIFHHLFFLSSFILSMLLFCWFWNLRFSTCATISYIPPSNLILTPIILLCLPRQVYFNTHTCIILCFYIKSKNHKGETIYNVFRCLINSFNVQFSSDTCFPVNHITVLGTGLELFSHASASQMLIL